MRFVPTDVLRRKVAANGRRCYCETVNLTELLAAPATLTSTGPVLAPAGTATVIEVPLHFSGVAIAPLNVTEPDPAPAPNPEPTIVTTLPGAPESGETAVMAGPAFCANNESESMRPAVK